MEKPHLSRTSRTKSLEERLQEYNETRARIFKVNILKNLLK